MEQPQDRTEQGKVLADGQHAGEHGPDFAAKREAYDTARDELSRLIDDPDKSVPIKEYRDQLVKADAAVQDAHEEMMMALRRSMYPARTRGSRRPTTPPTNAEVHTYPPDPYWGTDDRGRFRYVDYDGESLHVRHESDGDLWIDKKGEGPVYVRKEDVPVILAALNGGQA